MKRFYTLSLLITSFALHTGLSAETTPLSEQDSIVYLTSTNLDKVLSSDKPIIIDFYTEWCGPCKSFAPIFEAVQKEFTGSYLFVKGNLAENRALSERFQITAIPTVIFLKNDKEVGRVSGFMNKEAFKSKIAEYLK